MGNFNPSAKPKIDTRQWWNNLPRKNRGHLLNLLYIKVANNYSEEQYQDLLRTLSCLRKEEQDKHVAQLVDSIESTNYENTPRS